MNKRFLNLIIITVFALAAFSCALDTPSSNNGATVSVPGTDLVISEVFHIPVEKQYAYSWIELFNPTGQNMYWYRAEVLNDSITVTKHLLVQFLAKVRIYNFGNPSYVIYTNTMPVFFSNYYQAFAQVQDSIVLIGSQFDPQENTIFPGKFTIITNSLERFNRHYSLPPNDPVIFEPKFPQLSDQGTVQPIILVHGTNPLNPADTSQYFFGAPAMWDLLDENEVSLIRLVDTVNTNTNIHNQHTEVLDVVRYGGFVPTPDPYPNNIPLSNVPEGYSVARFKGYYATGNSSDDFYISNKPIPGWYSQIGKQ
jgi:hypothetical protein